jgi:hypothetical protein
MPVYYMEQWKVQRWKKGDRYYRCCLCQDLFGKWLVVTEWGGVLVGHRGLKEAICSTYEEALTHFESVVKRRTKRGYVAVG